MNAAERGRPALIVGALAAVAVVLAACQGDPLASAEAGPPTTSTVAAASVSVSVPDGTKDVGTESVISVKATGGALSSVAVATADGKRTLAGAVSSARVVWTSSGRLLPGTTYKVSATARNAAGLESTQTSTFSTVTPEKEINYTVTPDGWTVGAGMPVQVRFDAPVPSAQVKADIESRLTMTVTPKQPGAWGWISDRVLMFRPQSYWQAGTKIKVDAPSQASRFPRLVHHGGQRREAHDWLPTSHASRPGPAHDDSDREWRGRAHLPR